MTPEKRELRHNFNILRGPKGDTSSWLCRLGTCLLLLSGFILKGSVAAFLSPTGCQPLCPGSCWAAEWSHSFPSAGELRSQNRAPQRAFHSLNRKLTWGKGNGHTMAAFSGHTEDGDELFGRRFSVAYSHVGMRWWGTRGEDGLSPVVFQRRGSFPSPPVKMQWVFFVCFFCTSFLPSPICSHPRSWKLLLPRFNSSPWSQERMRLPLLCHTSFFLMFAF